MLIGVHGKARSGKDTVAKAIHYYLSDWHKSAYSIMDYENHLIISAPGWETRKFAQHVRHHVADILGVDRYTFDRQWELDQDGFRNKLNLAGLLRSDGIPYSIRELMITVGDGSRKLINENIWYNMLMRNYNNLNDNWIITDLRYRNCYANLVKEGAILIKVRSFRSLTIDNDSETELDNIPDSGWSHVFNNDTSIEDLYYNVRDWLIKVKLMKSL